MWCSTCRQDLPGVKASDGSHRRVCARCGAVVLEPAAKGGEQPAATESVDLFDIDDLEPASLEFAIGYASDNDDEAALPSALAAAVGDDAALEFANDWEFDATLGEAERWVKRLSKEPADAFAPSARNPLDAAAFSAGQLPFGAAAWNRQLHFPAEPLAGPHYERLSREKRAGGATQAGAKSAAASQHAKPPKDSLLGWAIIAAGLTAFACGGVLMGWSFAANKVILWNVGLPLALIGQAGLLLGLVFQLDGLWRTNRDTTAALDELDVQLSDLRHTTSLLGTTHGSAAQAFYSHVASGANSQVLLADLKGQLDMLAMQLARKQ